MNKRPQTVGRTKLISDGGAPVHEETPPEANPAVTPLPMPPLHAPERRRWEKKQRPAPATRQLRAKEPPKRDCTVEWDGEHLHDNCGGFVDQRPAGTGIDAVCTRCKKRWEWRRGCGWQRG
jgi:hypothetical protein